MILILTTESGDSSHIEVINWLEHLKANYIIIAGERLLRGDVSFTYMNNEIYYNGINLTNEISVVYYRRWLSTKVLEITYDKILDEAITENLYREIFEVKKLLESNFKRAIWIPKASSISVNKLNVLNVASEVGFLIPKTIVTNSKSDIINFINETSNGVITKAIGNYESMFCSCGDNFNPIYTKEINIIDINNCKSDIFVISLFQEKIDKLLELRVFFFMGQLYGTALLSQMQSGTCIDSRIMEGGNSSKLSPYQLPEEINKKIILLFEKLDLNIGSLDLLVTPDGDYYLLEVNPVGQISGYSRRCGFNIEKEIALKLIEIDERKL
ncbi:MAG: hypothetical protein R3Y59_09030 [bacterium]